MSSVNTKLFTSLKNVRTELGLLTPGDLERLAGIGATIEGLMTEYAEELAHANELLILCLTGLQKIYQDETADFSGIVDAAEAGLVAVEQSVASQNNEICQAMIEQGCNLLRITLGLQEESAEAEMETESEEDSFISVPPETLDDVSSLLMQISSDDKNEIEQIAGAFKSIIAQTENTAHRKMLVKSTRDLTKIINGKADNADEILINVGKVIETINSENENQLMADEKQEDVKTSIKIVLTPETEKNQETVKENVQENFSVSPSAAPENKIYLSGDDGLLNEFIIESRELIEAAEGSLLELENDPESDEAINTVFRAFHSVKGTSAFLSLNAVTDFAHLAESLLSRMRDHEIKCTGGYADLALRSVDVIKEMLRSIEEAAPGEAVKLPPNYDVLTKILENPEAEGITSEGKIQIENAVEDKMADLEDSPVRKSKTSADSSVRVRTDRLDSLIDMVGELVIAQSMLAQDATVMQGLHHELSRKISHAGKIVRELQDLSMGMRMIPLKSTFQKMARIVRDVAQKCGKQIEFVTEGEDTEIDRNMVDIIADPLVHMVRNAADHGIETPDKRTANGKSATGKIKLAAYHSGGDVVVELQDDGAGLDRDKILAKAIGLNLIESDTGMSESQIFNLIFAPGFSTVDEITDVSGRGVGMDVVKRNIEAMRGRIEISSEKGKGSIFTVRLPLTLAITDGMLIRVGTERFIVPTINIQLSFRPTSKMLSTVSGRGELVSLRGELMPIFRLHNLFEVDNAIENPTEALLMIVADGRRRCALMVDELLGQYQVVAKTLGDGIGKIQGVSGGAILGDGCVGLILDVAEVVALARRTKTAASRRGEVIQLAA